jgi:hypothetical protein
MGPSAPRALRARSRAPPAAWVSASARAARPSSAAAGSASAAARSGTSARGRRRRRGRPRSRARSSMCWAHAGWRSQAPRVPTGCGRSRRRRTAAHQRGRGKAVPQAKLAEGVGDVDGVHRAPALPSERSGGEAEPFGGRAGCPSARSGTRGARISRRSGCPGRWRSRWAAAPPPSSLGMGGGGAQTGRPASAPRRRSRSCGSSGQRRRGQLQRRHDRDVAGAPRAVEVPCGAVFLGRRPARNVRGQVAEQARGAAAAGIGVGVHPGVDQRQRDAARAAAATSARPEVLFGPDRQAGAPVVQELAKVGGASSGRNWCQVRGGRFAAITSAEARAVEVTRKDRSARLDIAAIRPRSARTSPMPTACSQISRPSGRGQAGFAQLFAPAVGSVLSLCKPCGAGGRARRAGERG